MSYEDIMGAVLWQLSYRILQGILYAKFTFCIQLNTQTHYVQLVYAPFMAIHTENIGLTSSSLLKDNNFRKLISFEVLWSNTICRIEKKYFQYIWQNQAQNTKQYT